MSSDFDQSDARELAEFAGLIIDEIVGGSILVKTPDRPSSEPFVPWSIYAPQWQIQSLIDAVRAKGLEEKFVSNLKDEAGAGLFKLASAPPEAICEAILFLMEGE